MLEKYSTYSNFEIFREPGIITVIKYLIILGEKKVLQLYMCECADTDMHTHSTQIIQAIFSCKWPFIYLNISLFILIDTNMKRC